MADNVYKNPNWPERKRELKNSRNQRTTKSIKNIRVIDSPCDPVFNCIIPSYVDCSIDVGPSSKPAQKYCDITGYEVKDRLIEDKVQGQCKRIILL